MGKSAHRFVSKAWRTSNLFGETLLSHSFQGMEFFSVSRKTDLLEAIRHIKRDDVERAKGVSRTC
jgi:hypothetical protein